MALDNHNPQIKTPKVFSEELNFRTKPSIGFENKKKKWGYFNSQGEKIVPLIYDEIKPYKEGYGAVKKDGKWGFIDKEGIVKIPIEYFKVDSYYNGLFAVKKVLSVFDQGWGFVDKDNNEVIPFIYLSVHFFGMDYLLVRTDSHSFKIIDKSNNCLLTKETGDISLASEFKDGFAEIHNWRNDKGIINSNLDIVVQPSYHSVVRKENYFYTSVDLYAGSRVGTKMVSNVFDLAGRSLVSEVYSNIENFQENIAVVQKGVWYGCINTNGDEVIPCRYNRIYNFNEGLAAACKSYLYGYIDKTGNELIPPIYNVASDFYEGIACVEINGKYGYINNIGEIVIELIYDKIKRLKSGLSIVIIDNKFGVLNEKSRILEIPIQYEEIVVADLDLKILFIKNNHKWGLATFEGNVILNSRYELIKLLKKDCQYFCVKQNGKWGVININEEIIAPYVYEEIGQYYSKEDLICVRKNWKWGLINGSGIEITPCKYSNIMTLFADLKLESLMKNNILQVMTSDIDNFIFGKTKIPIDKYGFINDSGIEVIPCEYDDSHYMSCEGMVGIAKYYYGPK